MGENAGIKPEFIVIIIILVIFTQITMAFQNENFVPQTATTHLNIDTQLQV